MNTGALLDWYGRARPLPWRGRATLRRARLRSDAPADAGGRVLPYYGRSSSASPPWARSPRAAGDVLRAWSGLGYNRRAMALQAAARAVAERGWPADLTELPGRRGLHRGGGRLVRLGRAGGRRRHERPARDRALGRGERTPAAARGAGGRAAPAGRAAAFNQAMMELGATVCGPRGPRCAACPVRRGCASAGRAHPAPAARRSRPAERFEDSDRWARGRIVAALVAGEPPPALERARRERAEAGLLRDGLAVRRADGALALP